MSKGRGFSAVLVFVVIICGLPFLSGAPLRVLLAEGASFALGFLVPALVTARRDWRSALPWLVGFGLLGLLLLDIWSSRVILKREFLMGWYLFYPGGLVVLLVAHGFCRAIAAGYQKIRGRSAY
jgi:biotin transporter BioY